MRLTDCTFYTDSSTDLELLTRVGAPRVVHPDLRLKREARAGLGGPGLVRFG